MAYITEDSTKEQIYEAYIETQKKLKATVFHKKEIQDKVREVRKEKNKKYNELRYQLLRKDQRIFRLNQHIRNLQMYAVKERNKAKKKGIEVGKSRVRVKDYSIIKMYEFLFQTSKVADILGMSLGHCAFILWAGRYEFFNVKDFKKDIITPSQTYHAFISYFRSRNFITLVSKDNAVNQYSLTATGISLFNKIDKFTKKHFNE
jgi:hypothetical protein